MLLCDFRRVNFQTWHHKRELLLYCVVVTSTETRMDLELHQRHTKDDSPAANRRLASELAPLTLSDANLVSIVATGCCDTRVRALSLNVSVLLQTD
ncbi:hypothetical protein F2P81_017579 [Scophthalmus maximus]|uniref:Uncharacterized protein n=1 Tax=Scophthalmus maximus TaxID=52904 RepID=A0A6A4SF50_SCOMX|nr:hypothetical protein F2P81_017579 [Scophthalmus maximus]